MIINELIWSIIFKKQTNRISAKTNQTGNNNVRKESLRKWVTMAESAGKFYMLQACIQKISCLELHSKFQTRIT